MNTFCGKCACTRSPNPLLCTVTDVFKVANSLHIPTLAKDTCLPILITRLPSTNKSRVIGTPQSCSSPLAYQMLHTHKNYKHTAQPFIPERFLICQGNSPPSSKPYFLYHAHNTLPLSLISSHINPINIPKRCLYDPF